MNLKTWLPLCLALVLGLVAAMYARNMMNKKRSDGPQTGKLVHIVVAKQPISAGEQLTAENCQLGNVGQDSVPDSSFRTVTDLKDRVTQVTLVKGQAVTENLLAPVGSGMGLQALIPNGMRGISLEINEFSGVGGMLLPGCHVDVLATMPGDNGGEMISRTVVQNVTVSAVGQRMTSQPKKEGDEPVVFRSVTLLATPAEAEAIELAATSGRPRLVLRNSNDKSISVTPGVTQSNLRGSHAAGAMTLASSATPSSTNNDTTTPVVTYTPAYYKPEPVFTIIKIIRGTTESEVRMDNGWFDSSSKVTNSDSKSVTKTDMSPATGDD